MEHTLVGHTGFVGGNLAASQNFNHFYNSKNIQDSFGAQNGLVVYSGMASEKFLANADPAADLRKAEQAMENIRRMKPEQLVLISTVDVYPMPVEVDEKTLPSEQDAPAYGKNRYQLEKWVREEYPDALLVRLPGLFGKGLKKNFIYDIFTITPSMLTGEKYTELSKEPIVRDSYEAGKPGFYQRKKMDEKQTEKLKAFFAKNDFNALCFTDSRSVFQFYNLANLWNDIALSLKNNLLLVNMATEPVSAAELYQHLIGKPFQNILAKEPARYDMKTVHADLWNGKNGYMSDKDSVLKDIVAFRDNWMFNVSE